MTALLLALALVAAGCSEPDRTNESDALAERIGELGGVADSRSSYVPDSIEFNESTELLAVLEPGLSDAEACAPVVRFLEEFPDTGIDPGQSSFEVRDDEPPTPWSFTVDAEVTDAGVAEAWCTASRAARGIPRATGARVELEANDLDRPTIVLNFDGGDVRSEQAGLRLAEEAVSSFDEFRWVVLVVCGDVTCR